MPTQVTTKKTETIDDDADELEAVTPLFDLGKDKRTKTVIRVAVKRTDPDEGHLGYLLPDATEADIAAKWGGGEFVVQGKNAQGQIVVSHTVKIAGDPVFKSEIEEARWRRLNNLRPSKRRDDDGGGSTRELLALIEEREEKRREEERERRAEEKREQAEREERNRREQREHEEKLARENAEREERRRKDDAERDERRRAQHREDLDRQAAAAAAQLAQTQQFFTQLQAMTANEGKAASHADPVKLLTAGMELALKLRGDGGGADAAAPADPITALLARLPETLAEVRTTAKEAYNEIKNGKRKTIDATATPAPAVDDDEEEEAVTITGETGAKVKQMIGILQANGKNAESVIAGMADHVIGLAARKKAPAQPTKEQTAARPTAPRAAARTARKASPPRRAPAPAKRQTKKAST